MKIGDIVEYDPAKKDVQIVLRTDEGIVFEKDKIRAEGTIIYMTSSGKKKIQVTEILNGV